MKQWLQAVVRYQRRKGDEYISRVVMPGTTRNLTYYEDMNQLLGMATEWMAGVFLTEYTFATETGMDRYTVEEEELYVILYQNNIGNLMAFPFASIPARWLHVGTLHEELSTIDIPLRINTGKDEVKRKKLMAERDKLKRALDVCSRVTAELTDLPDRKFKQALEELVSWSNRLEIKREKMERLE
ncbi:hypothetical protein PC116_g3534 [Phytophthora cactorum]|nr:hypothetical protein PC114_g9310 [Phytophthora cactorum]KAG3180060.1 hypothetical protein C6341_g7133 [Phytophthora cactorum]KAG4248764.1 hypothetical protein PC116_g3534 [Phytophthora cactorum]